MLIAGFFVPALQRVVPRRAKQPVETTLAYRWSRLVQAHPWASILIGSAVLLVMALPVLSLRLGFSDESNYSEETTTRRAYDLLVEGFGPGFNGPLIVVPSAVAGTGLDVNITGVVAANIDFSDYLSQRIVVFVGAVLALSFLLLMAVFRSILVPIKAVIMNLLSIAAAYGMVVAAFQWGWLGAVFGIESAPVEPFIPMMMFAIVFGLSMDYEVFLLSRIKEQFDRTGDAVGSVADGLASTARVITAAAAIMIVVFGSFVFEDDRIVQMFGFGLAVAILLDATIVRMLLVPATMSLLGARNWWLPDWLQRALPTISIEGELAPVVDATGD